MFGHTHFAVSVDVRELPHLVRRIGVRPVGTPQCLQHRMMTPARFDER